MRYVAVAEKANVFEIVEEFVVSASADAVVDADADVERAEVDDVDVDVAEADVDAFVDDAEAAAAAAAALDGERIIIASGPCSGSSNALRSSVKYVKDAASLWPPPPIFDATTLTSATFTRGCSILATSPSAMNVADERRLQICTPRTGSLDQIITKSA